MALWISLAVIAQLINAATVLIDKHLLVSSRGLTKPSVYAFYVSLLSGVVIIMVPFGAVHWPSLSLLGLSLLAALSYISSLICLYSALKIAIPSDVAPVAGGVGALATFVFAYWGMDQALPEGFITAFLLLTIGTLLISHFRFDRHSFSLVFLAGVAFGASTFFLKLIFLSSAFADGFFWSRMANVFVAALLLLLPGTLATVDSGLAAASPKAKWLAVGNKALAGIAFLLVLFAINLGNIALVNSLAGLQFVFLLALAYFLARRFPKVFHQESHPHRFPHKLFGVMSILFGFFALFF